MFLSEMPAWFLVLARVGGLLVGLPLFGLREIPVKLRVLLGVMIAVVLAPFLPLGSVNTLGTGVVLRTLGSELCIGLLLGFICRLVFLGLDAAGNLISTEMGLNMASQINPSTNAQTPVPGLILYWLAAMIWFSLDLHHWMIAAVQRSYEIVPVGGAHLNAALFNEVLHRSAMVFVIAVQVSAPLLGVSFVVNLALSVLGRAVPQMNVFSESFPIRTLAGLSVFGATGMFMAQHIVNYLRRLPEDTLQVLQFLGRS